MTKLEVMRSLFLLEHYSVQSTNLGLDVEAFRYF